MKAIKYHLERHRCEAANTLTEFVNNTQNRLNEDQPVIGDHQPNWELTSTTWLGDEFLFEFTCWDERY